MDNLDFRKFLTTYGISYEEYQEMAEEKKQELISKFKREVKTKTLDDVGKGLQGCGCLLILIPIILISLYFMYSFIKIVLKGTH